MQAKTTGTGMTGNKVTIVVRSLIGLTGLLAIGTLGLVLNTMPKRRKRGTLMRQMPADIATARSVFDRRVSTLIRPGMPTRRIMQMLAAEGFEVDAATASATYRDRARRMRRVWRVVWDSDDSRVQGVRASLGVSAL